MFVILFSLKTSFPIGATSVGSLGKFEKNNLSYILSNVKIVFYYLDTFLKLECKFCIIEKGGSELANLVAQERTDVKNFKLKKIRSEGKIPGVVYGNDISTKAIAVARKDLLKTIRDVGRNGILSLELNGASKNVILRDYQRDPVTNTILHVDFMQVSKDTKIDAKVNVVLKGTSAGEKSGGIVKQYLHELDVTAKANNLPDEIEIDITDVKIGRSVKVADIKKQYSDCTINHDDDETIVAVDMIKQKADEEEVTEEETASVSS